MKIDLTCPVERLRHTMPEKAGDECVCLMNNLSEKVVTSVQVTLVGYGENGEGLLNQTERVLGLRAGPGERFSMGFTPERWDEEIVSADLAVEKVWFDDATIWRRESDSYSYYTSNALPAGKALDQLRFVAGQDAVGYPQVQDQVWVCVCGRPNSHESRVCCRCHRGKEAVFASFSKENVVTLDTIREKTLDENSRKIRQENNLLQENREKAAAARRRRRKKALKWGIAGVCIALAAVAFVLWGLPALRYFLAEKQLEGGNPAQAQAAFIALGDYLDSQDKVLECDYVQAQNLVAQGDVESLELAQAAFEKLGDYADSAEKAKQTAYQLGKAYQEQGYYDLAAGKFRELEDWEDSEDCYLEAVWLQAEAARDSGSYETARLLFENLGDYRDASAQVVRCSCLLGEQYLEEGNYENALTELEGLDEDEEAAKLIQKARYLLAEERFSYEDYAGAGEMYLAAGDYEDAREKGLKALYTQGVISRESGEYDEAIALFEQLEDYQDSPAQAMNCRYLKAQALQESGDLTGAVECFGDSASTENMTEEIIAFLGDCHYELAQQALNAGDKETAEAELDNAVTYGKKATELNKLRYELAEQALAAGEYEEALERYVALGTYKNSAARAKQCRYALGEAAAAAGDYEKAIGYYQQLGNYKESKSRLEDCQYQQAEALYESGDLEGALSVLWEMTSTRAKTLRRSILKEQGAGLEEAGEYEAAANVYRQMGNSEGTELANAALYLQAEQLSAQGSYTEAAEAFRNLGTYQDAQTRAEECAAAVWGGLYQTVSQAMKEEDYVSAVGYLEGKDMEVLSAVYPELPEMYRQAAYLAGEKLYGQNQFYEALPYYQRAGEYKEANDKKLRRRIYFLLGEWSNSEGHTALFRSDYTCCLDGQEMVFGISGFNLLLGETEEDLTSVYSLTAVTETGLTLRKKSDSSVTKYTRVGDWVLPETQLTALELPQEETQGSEGEESPEDMLVEDEGDEELS